MKSNSTNIPLLCLGLSYSSENNSSSKLDIKFDKPVQVATLVRGRRRCPLITKLPGASTQLMSYVKNILDACEGLRVYRSKKLNWKRFKSLSLLYLDPPLFLVDGSDQVTYQSFQLKLSSRKITLSTLPVPVLYFLNVAQHSFT